MRSRFRASVRKMGQYAFSYSSLTTVNLPEDSQLTKISKGVFTGCQIATVSIPKGIAEIESGAFSSTGLVSVNFAEDSQLELIGNGAFQWSNLRKSHYRIRCRRSTLRHLPVVRN